MNMVTVAINRPTMTINGITDKMAAIVGETLLSVVPLIAVSVPIP